jgi:hypothetical protein
MNTPCNENSSSSLPDILSGDAHCTRNCFLPGWLGSACGLFIYSKGILNRLFYDSFVLPDGQKLQRKEEFVSRLYLLMNTRSYKINLALRGSSCR